MSKSPSKSVIRVGNFSEHGTPLRAHFQKRFEDPRALKSDRFVWDYWHVPNQYTLLRTPAYQYFPKNLYLKIHKELVLWGRRNLGCWDISPPWLSCYVDGCEQKFHSDVPHGPWAFVYSLSPSRPVYTGGETLLLNDSTLNYWKGTQGPSAFNEHQQIVQSIPARFNQLLVFDPRIPHGVSQVTGTHDPREGRLVLHGWFSQPKTYIEGTLPKGKSAKVLNSGFEQVLELVQQDPIGNQGLWGTLSVGLKVAGNGSVTNARFLSQTVKDNQGDQPSTLLRKILKVYQGLQFPKANGPSTVTVPLIFG